MNENEKAAHSIGWSQQCNYCGVCESRGYTAHRHDPGFVHYCDRHGMKVIHKMDCPDMSDPRNYMKAFKMLFQAAVKASGAQKYEEVHAALVRVLACDDDKPAVEYLAAIYDAEHLEGVSK